MQNIAHLETSQLSYTVSPERHPSNTLANDSSLGDANMLDMVLDVTYL